MSPRRNMIIKNTAENKRLVRKLRGIVNAEPGFRATVDCTWNCGKDIRLEIASEGWDAPLIVSTCLHEDGRFEILVRLLRQKFDADETWLLACRLNSVTTMRNRIGALTAQARPELSAWYEKENA